MSGAFDSIRKGLREATEYADGNKSGVRVYSFLKPDVKAIRNKTGMSQNEFATLLCISPNTLRYWEKGGRELRGTALVLLNIIDKAPQTVLNLLRKQS